MRLGWCQQSISEGQANTLSLPICMSPTWYSVTGCLLETISMPYCRSRLDSPLYPKPIAYEMLIVPIPYAKKGVSNPEGPRLT